MNRRNLRALEAMRPRGSKAHLALFLDYAEELRGGEVPDPYYGETIDFEHVLDIVTTAARGLLAHLQGGGDDADASREISRARRTGRRRGTDS